MREKEWERNKGSIEDREIQPLNALLKYLLIYHNEMEKGIITFYIDTEQSGEGESLTYLAL